MTRWPLLFTFQQKVYGNGFLASVTMHGKVLAIQEEEGVWMEGVQPGDLAAGGKDLYAAYVKFRKAFNETLEDMAEDGDDFRTFKTAVEELFRREDQEALRQWKEAVEEVRAGTVKLDNIQKKDADSPRDVTVELIEDFRENLAVLEKDIYYAMAA